MFATTQRPDRLVNEEDSAVAFRQTGHFERPSIRADWRLLAAARASYYRLLETIERLAPMALRVSLAVVFLWFGALKLAGDSPVLALVSATVPWLEPSLLIHLLGAVEVLLGVGLLLGRAQRLLLLVLAVHLSGTFLTFFMAPQLMFQHGGPMLLTADGEFVLKNLVLISAALLLAASSVSPPGRAQLVGRTNTHPAG